MSNKNKLGHKGARRMARLVGKRAASAVAERTPISPIAQKTSARVLSNPKGKLTGSHRRRLQKSRGHSLNSGWQSIHTLVLPPEVKVTLKLQNLTMVKLIRRLKQAARRASTCKHILLDLAPDSKFTKGLVAEQIHQLSRCRQISAEISVRNHQTQQ